MKNFKHSLIAVIAVAMISSLAVAQASGLNNSKTEREQRINAAAAEQSITIAQKDITDAVKGTAEISTESTETRLTLSTKSKYVQKLKLWKTQRVGTK